MDAGEARRSVDRGVLTVAVPQDARVTVNGMDTVSTGTERRYVSNGLKNGHSYRYEVTATVQRDGKPIEVTKTALLRAGQIARLDFDLDSPPTLTSLTVKVPEDADVFLSGNPTSTKGAVRRFSTSRLSEGEKWSDYVVRVSVERDGQTLTKEKLVHLSGGDKVELKFDFDQTELAANR